MAVMVISVLALLATICGVYYARRQLREAERVREQTKEFTDNQKRDDENQRRGDDLWAEKQVRVSLILCAVAPYSFQGDTKRPGGDALGLLFPDYAVRNRILSLLIEKQSVLSYTMRPLDVSQLRLKPLRELIDLVLNRIEEFKSQDPDVAKRIGL